MKFKLILLGAVALSAGCSRTDNAPAADTAPPVAATQAPTSQPAPATDVAPAAPATPAEKSLYSRLPDKAIRFGFPFEFKGDKTVQAANGTTRRGVAMGYNGMTADQMWSGIETALTNAGYRPAPRKADAEGKGSQLYVKSNAQTLSFSVSPRAADQGMVWIGWQVEQMGDASTNSNGN